MDRVRIGMAGSWFAADFHLCNLSKLGVQGGGRRHRFQE
jgi:hypothetical protein